MTLDSNAKVALGGTPAFLERSEGIAFLAADRSRVYSVFSGVLTAERLVGSGDHASSVRASDLDERTKSSELQVMLPSGRSELCALPGEVTGMERLVRVGTMRLF
jgi:hypothetical protein